MYSCDLATLLQWSVRFRLIRECYLIVPVHKLAAPLKQKKYRQPRIRGNANDLTVMDKHLWAGAAYDR